MKVIQTFVLRGQKSTADNIKLAAMAASYSKRYLDGQLDNYSGISVFDNGDNLIADGWMEFVHRGQFFLAYWDFVTIWENGKKIREKNEPGVPRHILEYIPNEIKTEAERNLG